MSVNEMYVIDRATNLCTKKNRKASRSIREYKVTFSRTHSLFKLN